MRCPWRLSKLLSPRGAPCGPAIGMFSAKARPVSYNNSFAAATGPFLVSSAETWGLLR